MFGKNKSTAQQEPPTLPAAPVRDVPRNRPAPPNDPSLPGIAGFEGPESISGLDMPVNRFRFIRPDQNPQR